MIGWFAREGARALLERRRPERLAVPIPVAIAHRLQTADSGLPSDLVLSALARAHYCELLAPKVPHGDSELFLVGLLSLMDAILDLPMGVVLDGINLDHDTKAVLLGQKGPLDPVYQLMIAHEAADWPKISALCSKLRLPEELAVESHWKAMHWAHATTSEVAGAAHA